MKLRVQWGVTFLLLVVLVGMGLAQIIQRPLRGGKSEGISYWASGSEPTTASDGELAEGITRSVTLRHRDHSFSVAPPDVLIRLKESRLSRVDKSDIEGLKMLIEGQDS